MRNHLYVNVGTLVLYRVLHRVSRHPSRRWLYTRSPAISLSEASATVDWNVLIASPWGWGRWVRKHQAVVWSNVDDGMRVVRHKGLEFHEGCLHPPTPSTEGGGARTYLFGSLMSDSAKGHHDHHRICTFYPSIFQRLQRQPSWNNTLQSPYRKA